MSMSGSQYRVIDPILTTHARGYRQAGHVGHLLFPNVDVTERAGKVIEFDRSAFVTYNARRAAGAATKRIEFGYQGKPYELVQDGLESKVPREFAQDAKKIPGIDLGLRATNTIMASLNLTLEMDQAALATTAANYAADHKLTLSGTSQWNDPAAKPVDQIEAARQVIRASCGLYPNILTLGPKPYSALKNSQQVKDRFRNTDVITGQMLASLLEVDQVVEGRAVVAGDDGTFKDVWGNYAVLGYAPAKPSGLEEPSYGYTYTMLGNPFIEEPYWEQNVKSHIFGGTYERAPVLPGMGAGFLFTNPSGL